MFYEEQENRKGFLVIKYVFLEYKIVLENNY